MSLPPRLPNLLCLVIAVAVLSGCCCVIPIPGPRPPLQPGGTTGGTPPAEQPRPSAPVEVPRPVPL